MEPGSYGHPVALFQVRIEHEEGQAPTFDEVLDALMGTTEGVAKAMVIEVQRFGKCLNCDRTGPINQPCECGDEEFFCPPVNFCEFGHRLTVERSYPDNEAEVRCPVCPFTKKAEGGR